MNRGLDALVIGGSGQVGQQLIGLCGRRQMTWKGTRHEHPEVGAGLLPLDLADLDSAAGLVRRLRPKAVYFPSGWTHVDACEDDEERALRVNALAPERAAKAAREVNAAFVFYSTEYVFGERGGPYDEKARPAPLGAYGRSKWEGEQRVRRAHPGALILRTTVVYGPEPQGKNTLYQVLKRLKAGQEVSLPSDQVTSPTYNEDLATASLDLVRIGAMGTYHVAGEGTMDRCAFAKLTAEVFGYAAQVRCSLTADLKQKARRPLDAGLVSAKLERALGWHPRGPRQGLEEARRRLGEYAA